MIRVLALALALLAPLPAAAERISGVVSATLRPGWRQADGTHVAALHLKLAPGWKTYWRAPGDAGIPPEFDWSGSRNLGSVAVTWPVPRIFHQSGMRSVGYKEEVVLPLTVRSTGSGDVRLSGDVHIGVCDDVCLPATLRVDGVLPSSAGTVDPAIAAALADRPFSGAEAGVGAVRCTVAQGTGGALTLRAEIEMPEIGERESVVIETANPAIWVAEPDASRAGNRLIAETELMHVDKRAFAVDRSGLRFTILGAGKAVDILGCTG
ncbi:protein-disulfide reductase DsbD domain-containing protein [Roseivivax sediminis]|uniref:Thiol-disulfide interchange protein, contains DsbC and DsbD domains n=1 Tax=Roseivivax sediminis TaxID=936889 RepID=A0A1I1SJM5_9RHOB|nr:protein-disulfide reductase DsbD domain-containing protein [Roseivivax sediminis]SFD46512.1 Thiol-disulfide interchange protein, contains DsbC and DsbD domains [Roseivivax sediminis]